jgi:hypothetical protein
MLFFVRNIFRTFVAHGGVHELSLSATVGRVARKVYEERFAEARAESTPASVVVAEMLEWLGPAYDVRLCVVLHAVSDACAACMLCSGGVYAGVQGHMVPLPQDRPLCQVQGAARLCARGAASRLATSTRGQKA